MFWWILLGISLIMTIIGIIFICIDNNTSHYVGDMWHYMCAVLGGFITVVILLVCITFPIAIKSDINQFIAQKEYIESLDDSNHNIAITTKKVELNEWLYDAQYAYENYRFFTFYDSSIMELEEIK